LALSCTLIWYEFCLLQGPTYLCTFFKTKLGEFIMHAVSVIQCRFFNCINEHDKEKTSMTNILNNILFVYEFNIAMWWHYITL